MWLLDVHTFKLTNFFGTNVGTEHPYAILSHTWEQEEVTFQDMQNLRIAESKAGFWKIRKTCEQAKDQGLGYVWVDTCCIDKTSSAELQEAINSMFEWYARAKACFAYLADVDGTGFTDSRWFTRGWTLQELIAPLDVDFYDKYWRLLGTREEFSTIISDRTGIEQSVLGTGPITTLDPETRRDMRAYASARWIGGYSVAQKMSWASRRETSRVEDRAYCMLGLFGVSIPLLYGEGRQSFIRLQEEILRINPDLSILAWEPFDQDYRGVGIEDSIQTLFAPSPRAFQDCSNLFFHGSDRIYEGVSERTISAVGIRAKLPILPIYVDDHEGADFAVILNCYDRYDVTRTIVLKLVSQRTVEIMMPEVGPKSTETMQMLPYSRRYMQSSRTKRRTLAVDVIQAEQDTLPGLQQVVLLRRAQVKPTDWVFPLADELVAPVSTPLYIWFRFSSARLPGAPWKVAHLYPTSQWKDTALTFRVTGEAQNYIMRPAGPDTLDAQLPFIVGAIALRKHDIINSSVVISFACPVFPSSWPYGRKFDPEARKIFFRVEAVSATAPINEDSQLSPYCQKLMTEDVPIDKTAFLRGRDLTCAKGILLYEGTRLYDAAVFAVKPEVRKFAGSWTVVLHAFDLTDLSQLQKLDEASEVPINKRIG